MASNKTQQFDGAFEKLKALIKNDKYLEVKNNSIYFNTREIPICIDSNLMFAMYLSSAFFSEFEMSLIKLYIPEYFL